MNTPARYRTAPMCGSFIGGISTTSPCSNSTRLSPKTPASMARWYSSRVQWCGEGASAGEAVAVDIGLFVLVERIDQVVQVVVGGHGVPVESATILNVSVALGRKL